MKQRMVLRLSASLVLAVIFVLVATILEANNSLEPRSWLSAQRHTELLWVVDVVALMALLALFGIDLQHSRLAGKSEEIVAGRDAHQAQLTKMIRNAEQMDKINAEQAEQIMALEQTVTTLSTQLTDLQMVSQSRQQTMEAEAHHLSEQASAALSGQVEANTRQMEAVNLALQYQRAEIKLLRQGVRNIQRSPEPLANARMTPLEFEDLEAEALPRLLENPVTAEQSVGQNQEANFFAPTLNAASTFISPLTAFAVTSGFAVLSDSMIISETQDTRTDNAETNSDKEIYKEICSESSSAESEARMGVQAVIETTQNVPTLSGTLEPTGAEKNKTEENTSPPSGLTAAEYQWLLSPLHRNERDSSEQPGGTQSASPPSLPAVPRGWNLRM